MSYKQFFSERDWAIRILVVVRLHINEYAQLAWFCPGAHCQITM